MRVFLIALLALAGCRSVSETRALKRVDFGLAGVQDATLAGVALDSVRSVRDMPSSAMAAVAGGLLRGNLPLSLGLVIGARNPADNPQARIARFDWTLFLDDNAAASGTVARGPTIAPGDSASFVIPVNVNLVDVAGDNASELLRMALAVAGRRADPSRVRLEARPYVETPFGSLPLKTETVVARVSDGRIVVRGDTVHVRQ